MAFRTAVYVRGESNPSYNSLVFATAEEAERYGSDLYSRWTMCERTAVESCDGKPNYRMTPAGPKRIEPTSPETVSCSCGECDKPAPYGVELGGEA